MKIELTSFVMRQFDAKFAGTKMHKVDVEHFMNTCNIAYDIKSKNVPNMDLYYTDHKSWDFCKYLFIRNYKNTFDINTSVVKLDHTNCQYVQSSYSSRRPEELAVLSRWIEFPKTANYKAPSAEWIGLVLYSREQLLEEFNKQPASDVKFELSEDCEYGIVAIMGLTDHKMEPMPPITHLRNALGKEQGGNGEPIDIVEYNESVEFWQNHILVK